MSLDDLERRLWDAANALRGPVDPADFKTYVFPMLFWKWISDNYDWERARAVADYGDDVDPEVEADFHKFELPAGTHWRDVTTKTANLGAQINKALGQIEQANPDSLAGMFGDGRLLKTTLCAQPTSMNQAASTDVDIKRACPSPVACSVGPWDVTYIEVLHRFDDEVTDYSANPVRMSRLPTERTAVRPVDREPADPRAHRRRRAAAQHAERATIGLDTNSDSRSYEGGYRTSARSPRQCSPVGTGQGVLKLIADSGNRSPLIFVELSYGVNRIPDPTDRGCNENTLQDADRRTGARHRRDGRVLVHDRVVGGGAGRRYRLRIIGGVSSGIVCGFDGPSAVA